MKISEKIQMNKLYLEMKKELMCELIKTIEYFKFRNNYYMTNDSYKYISVTRYLDETVDLEQIEYLQLLGSSEGINVKVKYSPYRPVIISANYTFVKYNTNKLIKGKKKLERNI